MTLFSGQIYGGMGQMGAHNKAAAAPAGPVAAWLYGDYGGSGGARIDASNCVAAYCPIGAASLAASKSNLASPGTYDATGTGGANWSVGDGWVNAPGSTANLSTGIGAVAAVANWTFIIRFSAVSDTNTPLFGARYGASDKIGAFPNTASGVGYWNGNVVYAAPAMTAGVLAVAKTAGYRNGNLDATLPGNYTGHLTRYIYVFWFDGEAQTMDGKVQAFWIYNSVLTAQQIAGLTGAINALTSAGNYYL